MAAVADLGLMDPCNSAGRNMVASLKRNPPLLHQAEYEFQRSDWTTRQGRSSCLADRLAIDVDTRRQVDPATLLPVDDFRTDNQAAAVISIDTRRANERPKSMVTHRQWESASKGAQSRSRPMLTPPRRSSSQAIS